MLKEIKISELLANQYKLYSAIKDGESTDIENQLAKGTNLAGYDLSDIVNCYTHRDNTPLIDAVMYDKVEAVKFLLSNGADSNLKDKFGNSPLHYAAYNKNQEISELLLKHNANINDIEPKNGRTVLHLILDSIEFKAAEGLLLLKYFIDNGADINIANKNGITPINLIKSKGINIDIENKVDDTTLMPDLLESTLNENTKMLGIDTHEE